MKFHSLTSIAELDEALKRAESEPIMLYKHSTRCNISDDALRLLETEGAKVEMPRSYYLDLIRYREVSNAIEERLNVRHQSPQVLVVFRGKVLYHESHWRISVEAILNAAKAALA